MLNIIIFYSYTMCQTGNDEDDFDQDDDVASAIDSVWGQDESRGMVCTLY